MLIDSENIPHLYIPGEGRVSSNERGRRTVVTVIEHAKPFDSLDCYTYTSYSSGILALLNSDNRIYHQSEVYFKISSADDYCLIRNLRIKGVSVIEFKATFASSLLRPSGTGSSYSSYAIDDLYSSYGMPEGEVVLNLKMLNPAEIESLGVGLTGDEVWKKLALAEDQMGQMLIIGKMLK